MAIAFAHSLDEMAEKLPAPIGAMVLQDDPVATGNSVAGVLVGQFEQCERFLANFASDDAIRVYIATCEYPRHDSLKIFKKIIDAGMLYGPKFFFAEFFLDFADQVFLPQSMGGEDVLPLASGYTSEVLIDKIVMEVVTFIIQFASTEDRTTFEKSLEDR